VPCPKCGEPFPVAAQYTPAVDPGAGPTPVTLTTADRPMPPPGLIPPVTNTAAPPPPAPAGYERTRGFTLSPKALAWVPAACLTLIFLFSFFTWVGSYADGYTLYSQSAWQTLSGAISVNATVPADAIPEETDIMQRAHTSWWMVPYLLLLVLTLIAAWAERILGASDRAKLPPHVARLEGHVWPWRFAGLVALTAVLLLLLVLQSWRGFGLERAVWAHAADRAGVTAPRDPDTPLTQREEREQEIRQGLIVNRFGLNKTWAYSLSILAHFVALIVLLALLWLDRRGNRPTPRVAMYS
jgi:hypothetical protein